MQITCCEKLNTKLFRHGVVWKHLKRKKKLFGFVLFGFFSSHSTSLTVVTSEIWLFMDWNCTTAETSKLTEEGNGGSVPAKNTTSPASWQEDSATPVQLVFPSPATPHIFRWPQEEPRSLHPRSLFPCNELYPMDTTTTIWYVMHWQEWEKQGRVVSWQKHDSKSYIHSHSSQKKRTGFICFGWMSLLHVSSLSHTNHHLMKATTPKHCR